MTPSQPVELCTKVPMESGLQTLECQRTPDLWTWTQNSRPRIPLESRHQTGMPPDSGSPDLEFRWTPAFLRNTTGIPADSGWNPVRTCNSGPIFTRVANSFVFPFHIFSFTCTFFLLNMTPQKQVSLFVFLDQFLLDQSLQFIDTCL